MIDVVVVSTVVVVVSSGSVVVVSGTVDVVDSRIVVVVEDMMITLLFSVPDETSPEPPIRDTGCAVKIKPEKAFEDKEGEEPTTETAEKKRMNISSPMARGL